MQIGFSHLLVILFYWGSAEAKILEKMKNLYYALFPGGPLTVNLADVNKLNIYLFIILTIPV